jgi:hypothetical protein
MVTGASVISVATMRPRLEHDHNKLTKVIDCHNNGNDKDDHDGGVGVVTTATGRVRRQRVHEDAVGTDSPLPSSPVLC